MCPASLPTNGRQHRCALCLNPLSLVMGKSSERPGAVKGGRFVRGGGKSFPVLKRFSGAHPGRRGPFWKLGRKGKRAGGLRGASPLAGIRGSAPRTLPRAVFARGIKQSQDR